MLVTYSAPFRDFVVGLNALVDGGAQEADILGDGARLLAELVRTRAWLPVEFRAVGSDAYRQYLLYRDPAGRFSVVCFVWAPGQGTPIHDHGVWGLVGVLEGAELSQHYSLGQAGLFEIGDCERLEAGEVAMVSPAIGDIHRVTNALPDMSSISIHVYGADIGRHPRRTYAPDGTSRSFVSGYANAHLSPPWNAPAGL